MAKKRSIPTSDTGGLTSNPFASLAPDKGGDEPAAAPDPDRSEEPPVPGRAVVGYERKGRGGKEVTPVELRGLDRAHLEPWLTRLKRSLGCGGFVEDDRLILAGDQRERVAGLLGELGISQISVS